MLNLESESRLCISSRWPEGCASVYYAIGQTLWRCGLNVPATGPATLLGVANVLSTLPLSSCRAIITDRAKYFCMFLRFPRFCFCVCFRFRVRYSLRLYEYILKYFFIQKYLYNFIIYL